MRQHLSNNTLSLNKIKQSIINNIAYFKLYALSVGGAKGVIQNFGSALISLVATPFKMLLAGFSAIKTALIALTTTPIGLTITAIATAAFLVYKYWEPIKAFLGGIWDGLKEGLSPIIQTISVAFAPLKPIFSFISDFFSSLFSQSEVTKESLSGFASVGKMVGNVLVMVFNAITYPLQIVIKSIQWIFKTIASSSVGKWLGEKLGISINDEDIKKLNSNEFKTIDISQLTTQMPNAITQQSTVNNYQNNQTTKGTIDKVISDKYTNNTQNTTRQINDNKKIDIHMHGTQATPEAVAVAVASERYSFTD
ncbi:hypothetical protein [Campylobacter pinnipediorum]|uniref:hypothetical protein n=1 Tax=Campylobacter pinnipediorum TaxID=1965231 RepID=UPI0009950DC0|nr:hypothetical protein [Campylobacter pinnipediorum]